MCVKEIVLLPQSSISKAQSYEEMAKFWDTHSTTDFEDKTL